MIILELRQKHSLPILLKLSNIPRSTYYNIANLEISDKYIDIKEKMIELFKKHKQRLGYRSMQDYLKQEGVKLNHKTVYKLMKQLNLVCKVRRKRFKTYKGVVGRIAPNILNRDFIAESPCEKLITDVTQFNINNTKV